MTKLISYKNSTLAYRIYGSGTELLLAFHGYGKDGGSLRVLADIFGDIYTVVSVDMFAHGQSEWNEASPPGQKDWEQLVQTILDENGNPPTFSIFGYSIGGRAATYTAHLFAPRIKKLWLMAASGIGSDGFFRLAVTSAIGNLLFKVFVKKPGFIKNIMWVLRIFGFLPANLYNFAIRKIDTPEKRRLLYRRWRALKNFESQDQLKTQLNDYKIKVWLVFAKKDYVIKFKTAQRFAKGIRQAKLFTPNAGHHLVEEGVLRWLKERTYGVNTQQDIAG